MAIPPMRFDTTAPEPLDTNVIHVQGRGLAYEPVGDVIDESTGEAVARAWEMESDAPRADGPAGEDPSMPGPRPYDEVTTRLRVYVRDPKPGRRYRLHIGGSTHRVTFAESVRVEHPDKGSYETPGKEGPAAARGARGWWRRWFGGG